MLPGNGANAHCPRSRSSASTFSITSALRWRICSLCSRARASCATAEPLRRGRARPGARAAWPARRFVSRSRSVRSVPQAALAVALYGSAAVTAPVALQVRQQVRHRFAGNAPRCTACVSAASRRLASWPIERHPSPLLACFSRLAHHPLVGIPECAGRPPCRGPRGSGEQRRMLARSLPSDDGIGLVRAPSAIAHASSAPGRRPCPRCASSTAASVRRLFSSRRQRSSARKHGDLGVSVRVARHHAQRCLDSSVPVSSAVTAMAFRMLGFISQTLRTRQAGSGPQRPSPAAVGLAGGGRGDDAAGAHSVLATRRP